MKSYNPHRNYLSNSYFFLEASQALKEVREQLYPDAARVEEIVSVYDPGPQGIWERRRKLTPLVIENGRHRRFPRCEHGVFSPDGDDQPSRSCGLCSSQNEQD